jgi:hypothetical protein
MVADPVPAAVVFMLKDCRRQIPSSIRISPDSHPGLYPGRHQGQPLPGSGFPTPRASYGNRSLPTRARASGHATSKAVHDMCGWNHQAVARGQRPGSAGEDRPGRITGRRFLRYRAERISYQSTGLRLRSSARRPVAFCSGSANGWAWPSFVWRSVGRARGCDRWSPRGRCR